MKENINTGPQEAGRGWTILIWLRKALVNAAINLAGSINLGKFLH